MKTDDFLNIRYVKLHFTVAFVEDTECPKYKASALRGGMGEMLLRINCIRDRECEKCDFESECLVQRIMRSKMEIQPEFMSAGDSVGYVVECEDYHTHFSAGDTMSFQVLLFGKTVVYFGQILDAFYRLGLYGIGKNHSKYDIISVTNTKKKSILIGNDIHMDNYTTMTIRDYVVYRKRDLESGGEHSIKFQSPLSVKYKGVFIDHFDVEAVIEATKRRIYILDCFEGIICDTHSMYEGVIPKIAAEEHHKVEVPRYSNRKDEKMVLRGIEGMLSISEISEELLDILIAGELIHIGKNTSFGFGRYRIMGG